MPDWAWRIGFAIALIAGILKYRALIRLHRWELVIDTTPKSNFQITAISRAVASERLKQINLFLGIKKYRC